MQIRIKYKQLGKSESLSQLFWYVRGKIVLENNRRRTFLSVPFFFFKLGMFIGCSINRNFLPQSYNPSL